MLQIPWKMRGSNSKMLQYRWNGSFQRQNAANCREDGKDSRFKKIQKRKTIIPKTIRTHYIIWYYIIYIHIYIIHVLHQTYANTYITLHYITLHTSVRTYIHTSLRYVTLRYVTLRYVTLRYVTLHTYIFTFDIYTRMYILRMIYIYIDTQCIHIYSVHNWNQLGAAPAGCAWWLWHCSVDSGPCKRLNSQCHGSILISEEKYISSIKLWTAEILSSAETFSEFLNALRSKFTTGSTHSLKFHHRKLRHRKFRHRKRAYSRPGLKIHWFLHWIAPFMFLFLPLYFSLLFCDLYKKIMVLQGSQV